MDRIKSAFFELLRSGLWESPAILSPYLPVDLNEIYSLANQQGVIGLVSSGLGLSGDLKLPKSETRKFVLDVGGIVTRNIQMNDLIASLMKRFENEAITAVVVKGQGIALCYEKPLWRSSGDVDILFDEVDYERAKELLSPLADKVEEEVLDKKHLALHFKPFEVELHGTLRSLKNPRVDRFLDLSIEKMFKDRDFCVWDCNGTDVLLPSVQNNVIIIFTHILQHFFSGGIGLRQLCDWCRLLWVFRDKINQEQLNKQLLEMGIMTEWKAFGCVAVDFLGLPVEAMPFYNYSFYRRASRIVNFILKVGNFGHNRDSSFYHKYPYVVRKPISFGRQTRDTLTRFTVFPLDASRYFFHSFIRGVRALVRGE